MNLLELLTEIEQQICMQLLMGITPFMVTILNRCTIAEVNKHRLSIIYKLTQTLSDDLADNYYH